jgi:hypothetical protein
MPLRWSRLREWNEANVALVHLQRGVSSRLMHWESVQCERSFSIQNVGLNFATGPNLTQTDAVSFGSFCSNARTGFHLRRTSPSGTGHPFQAALPVPQSSINGVRIGQTRTQRFRPLVAMDLVRGDGPLQRCSWQAHSERKSAGPGPCAKRLVGASRMVKLELVPASRCGTTAGTTSRSGFAHRQPNNPG